MSRVLLVTQSARSIGEFRRSWVRALYGRYVRRYRRVLAAAVAQLARAGDVTLLAARELVDETAFPPGVIVRHYDEESFQVDAEELARLTRHLSSTWWSTLEGEPSLRYRGVWLPELLSISRGLVLRLEIAEPLGTVEKVLRDTKPDRVVLLSETSMPERLARLLADRQGVPVTVAAPAFPSARLYGVVQRALFSREERLRLREVVEHPRRGREASPEAHGSRILLVTCRSRHHYVIDPLAAALCSSGIEARVVAAPSPELAPRLATLGHAGIACDWLTDYLPRADALRLVRRYRPVFRRLWRRIDGDQALAGRLVWTGVPLAGIVRPFLRDAVELSLLSAVLYQEAAFRALDALAPRAVIVTSNRRYAERAMALAARARRVPCLIFSNTLVLARDRSDLVDVGDRILVIGEHLRQALVREHGVDPARITVVGDPRSHAARLLPRDRLRAEVLRDFGLTADRPVLVVVSKYVSLLFSTREKEQFYRTVRAATQRLGTPHVVIKVHPNEDVALLRRQLTAWEWPDARLTKEYDIHRLFGAADAAIMVTSMAGIEAMAMGCPVVAVQTPRKDFEGGYMLPYVTERTVERVDTGDPTALAAALDRVLSDREARAALVERGRRFAARYINTVDGRLADRLLSVVDEVQNEVVGGRSR